MFTQIALNSFKRLIVEGDFETLFSMYPFTLKEKCTIKRLVNKSDNVSAIEYVDKILNK